jgi:NO-binding membrane sensor protein with MHYT domain
LKINDFEFGLIGSVVYAGMAAGSVIASGLFNNASWIKSTIIGVVSLNAVAVWTFQITRNFYFDLFVRFVIGVVQVFPAIYWPLWVDLFAHNTQKSSWLTI